MKTCEFFIPGSGKCERRAIATVKLNGAVVDLLDESDIPFSWKMGDLIPACQSHAEIFKKFTETRPIGRSKL